DRREHLGRTRPVDVGVDADQAVEVLEALHAIPLEPVLELLDLAVADVVALHEEAARPVGGGLRPRGEPGRVTRRTRASRPRLAPGGITRGEGFKIGYQVLQLRHR